MSQHTYSPVSVATTRIGPKMSHPHPLGQNTGTKISQPRTLGPKCGNHAQGPKWRNHTHMAQNFAPTPEGPKMSQQRSLGAKCRTNWATMSQPHPLCPKWPSGCHSDIVGRLCVVARFWGQCVWLGHFGPKRRGYDFLSSVGVVAFFWLSGCGCDILGQVWVVATFFWLNGCGCDMLRPMGVVATCSALSVWL